MSESDNGSRTIAPHVFLLTVGFAMVKFIAGAPLTIEGLLVGTGRVLAFLVIMVPITLAAMHFELRLKDRHA